LLGLIARGYRLTDAKVACTEIYVATRLRQIIFYDRGTSVLWKYSNFVVCESIIQLNGGKRMNDQHAGMCSAAHIATRV